MTTLKAIDMSSSTPGRSASDELFPDSYPSSFSNSNRDYVTETLKSIFQMPLDASEQQLPPAEEAAILLKFAKDGESIWTDHDANRLFNI